MPLMEGDQPRSHAEIVTDLRLKLVEAQRLGLVPAEFKEFYETTLLQLLNEAERHRQGSMAAAQRLREQAAAEEAKAKAFTMSISSIQSVVNGFIGLERRRLLEEAERKAEKGPTEAADPTSQSAQTVPAPDSDKPKNKGGRPPGSKNKAKKVP